MTRAEEEVRLFQKESDDDNISRQWHVRTLSLPYYGFRNIEDSRIIAYKIWLN
jgi:hypothetical protein